MGIEEERPDLTAIAWEALRGGHYRFARGKAEEALLADGTDALAHYVLSRCLAHDGELSAALDEARAALQFNAGEALYHWSLGDLMLLGSGPRSFRAEDAMPHFREAHRLAPHDAFYGLMLIENLIVRAKGLLPEPGAPFWEEAQQLLESLMAAGLTKAYHRGLAADALVEFKRFEEALAVSEELIAEEPHDASHWVRKVDCLRQLKRFEEAIATAWEARSSFPTHPSLWRLAAQCFYGLWRLDEAERTQNEYLTLTGGDPLYDDLLRTISNCRRKETPEPPPKSDWIVPPGPWDTCSHPTVRARDLHAAVRLYLCEDCGAAMRCQCEVDRGQYLAGSWDSDWRDRTYLGPKEGICAECRGLPLVSMACGYGGRVAQYYWREILYMRTELFAKRWPERKLPDLTLQERAVLQASSDDALAAYEAEQSARSEALTKETTREAREHFKRLHARAPKYRFQ